MNPFRDWMTFERDEQPQAYIAQRLAIESRHDPDCVLAPQVSDEPDDDVSWWNPQEGA